MLIELLKPRRGNTPVTLPDGNPVQFNEDASGRLIAEVANDQAVLILKHKTVFAPAMPPAAEDAYPTLRPRGRKRIAE